MLAFRLYNVSGIDAVELHLRSSDIRRIGTDDPQGLAGALKAAAAYAQGWSMESLAERYLDVYERAIAAFHRGAR